MISGAHVEEIPLSSGTLKKELDSLCLDHNIGVKYSQEPVLHIKQNFQTEREFSTTKAFGSLHLRMSECLACVCN